MLAIDDDPSMRQMLADYLGDNDIEVTVIGRGMEIAQAMARETIDPIIFDLKLPGEDGMQIARELAQLIRTERGAGYFFTAAVETVR